MINRNHTQIHMAALISILLLIGQFGVLFHAVDHSFHEEDQSCQIFQQCERLGDGLISPMLQLTILVSRVQSIPQIVSIWLSLPQSAYFSRAPPSLL